MRLWRDATENYPQNRNTTQAGSVSPSEQKTGASLGCITGTVNDSAARCAFKNIHSRWDNGCFKSWLLVVDHVRSTVVNNEALRRTFIAGLLHSQHLMPSPGRTFSLVPGLAEHLTGSVEMQLQCTRLNLLCQCCHLSFFFLSDVSHTFRFGFLWLKWKTGISKFCFWKTGEL